LGGPKQRAVLGVLLASRNALVSIDRIIDEVWGDSPPPGASRSVQVYVSALRSALGADARALQTSSGGYRLSVADEQLDARRFEAAATRTKALLAGSEASAAADVAAAGLALWRGPAFSGCGDSEVGREEATRLEALRLELIEDRMQAELSIGRHRHVVTDLGALVEAYPLRERLRAQLMLALHGCGRQAEALEVYRAGRRCLVEDLGIEPGQELQRLHEAILRDDPQLIVEPSELRGRRHLPSPATPLVGRRAEIEEITGVLRNPDVRLVTATGAGGIGKTRLALQAAHELADAFEDGVFFVGLAEVRDPGLVVTTVAESLGVDGRPDQPPLAAVQEHLAGRRVLVVLDNFEHVDEAAPLVGQLLAAVAGLKVLVTSRSPLRIYGEHEYPVRQLTLEDEAVPLFEARARAAERHFRLTDSVADAVRQICLRLDCLPLAIELAAARAADLAPHDMLRLLPRTLELAVSGPRDHAVRQQTLRAAIDWSHRLLSPDVQRVFTELAVFVGGFTVATAAEVCGATEAQLSSLASSSLIVAGGGDELRYDMLETIREYGLERLGQADPSSPDFDSARDRHAHYFSQLAEMAAPELRGPDQFRWVAVLQTERANVRAALEHLLSAPRGQNQAAEQALRLAGALGYFWYKTGSGAEGTTWLQRALAAARGAPAVVRARALHSLGILIADRGDAAGALAYFEESGELFREAGELDWMARSLNSQGGIARDLGEFERAERVFEECVDIRRTLEGAGRSLAIVLGNLAMVALDQQDLARARAIGEECLEMARETDQWVHAVTMQFLADVAVEQGDGERARELLRGAIPVLQDLGDTHRLVECLDSCAGVAACLGLWEAAARLLGSADAALEELDAQTVPADARLRERRTAGVLAGMGQAAFQAAQQEGRSMSLQQALDYARDEVSEGARSGGRPAVVAARDL